MTLKKSSVNPFRFTFVRTCKKNILVPVAVLLFTAFIFPAGVFMHVYSIHDMIKFGNAHGYELLENTKFVLGRNDVGYMGFFADAFCVLLGVLLAVSIFRYSMSKKSVNVYYSLGITRMNLFLAKYLSGIFMLTVAVAVPMTVSVIVNVVYFGSSAELWINALFLFALYLGLLVYSFTVASFVCCCVGTSFEAIVFGLSLAAAPIIIELLFQSFFTTILFGSSLNELNYYEIGILNGNYHPESHFSFLQNTILLFTSPSYSKHHEFISESSNYISSYVKPEILPVVIQFAFTAAAFIASVFSYKKRKAEIAGFLGANAIITSLGTFIISCAVIFLAGKTVVSYSKGVLPTVLICALIILIVYFVVEIISHRNIKLFIKKLWKLPVHFVIMDLIILVFTTGMFGYSSKVPAPEDVKKVLISTGTDDIFLFDMNADSIVYSNANYNNYLFSNTSNRETVDKALATNDGSLMLVEFDEKKDIEKIVETHKKLIELKNNKSDYKFGKRTIDSLTMIVYELNDGTKIERLFTVSNDEIRRDLASLTRTQNYIKQSADFFLLRISQFTELQSVFLSPDLSSKTVPEEFDTKAENAALVKAIYEDILSENLPLDFNTDSHVTGYISFVTDASYFFEQDHIVAYSPQDFDITIPIYESMSNTLNIIKEKNGVDYFSNLKYPIKVEKWKLDSESSETDYYRSYNSLLNGFWYSGKNYVDKTQFSYGNVEGVRASDIVYVEHLDEYEYFLAEIAAPSLAKTAIEVTDPNEFDILIKNIRMLSLDCFDGYYVKLTYEDGSASYGYVPLSVIN